MNSIEELYKSVLKTDEKLRSNKHSHDAKKIRKALSLRDYSGGELSCIICNTNENIQCGHIVPKSHGGKPDIGNFVALCKKHNGAKECSTINFYEYAYIKQHLDDIPKEWIDVLEEFYSMESKAIEICKSRSLGNIAEYIANPKCNFKHRCLLLNNIIPECNIPISIFNNLSFKQSEIERSSWYLEGDGQYEPSYDVEEDSWLWGALTIGGIFALIHYIKHIR